MDHGEMDIYAFLNEHGIHYESYEHPPVFTCEQADRLVPASVPGTRTKNLFLRDKKARRHFLVVVGNEKSVDLRELGAVLGVSKLTLASAERLRTYLNVDPGSVTLLGVCNDPEQRVEVIVDEPLWRSDSFRCHPLVNTRTLVIPKGDLERFLALTGHEPRVLEVPARNPARE